MGRFITLPGVNPPSDRPRIDTIDPILPENGGALLLLDVTHPASPWASGVPAHNATLVNVAQEQADATVGATVVPPTFLNYGFTDGTYGGADFGFVERTPRGGLHVAWTQRDHTAIENGKGVGVTTPDQVETYIAAQAGSGHVMYASFWSLVTRRPYSIENGVSAQPTWSSFMSRTVQPTSLAAWAMIDQTAPNTVQSTRVGFFDTGASTLGQRRRSIASQVGGDWSASSPVGLAFCAGTIGATNQYQDARRNIPSQVFYRAYVEDLTVSGRSFAEVDAIDAWMFAAAFGEGGRFHGDTFTDPTTVA